MMTPEDQIVDVLRELMALVGRPGTDVAWSHYDSPQAAAADLRGHMARLITGDRSGLNDLALLFAPTGALQEISINSGWGGQFLLLSAQFDAAFERMAQQEPGA